MNRFGYKKKPIAISYDAKNMMCSTFLFFNQTLSKRKKSFLSEEIAVYGKWDAKRKALNGMKILGSQNNG